LLRTFSPLVD